MALLFNPPKLQRGVFRLIFYLMLPHLQCHFRSEFVGCEKEGLEQKVQAVFEKEGLEAARKVAWKESIPWLKVGVDRVGRKFKAIGKVGVFLWRIGS
ncbi:hypothetical protein AB1K42_15810 [Roseibium algicola]|uniref:hypothetical protein n=1 Tax=Roseibium algicola TaxID=2857014 RepID=UPI0034582E50